ncbi:serine hydrolase domain-containing protein [Parafilimonas terrae]|uniref:Beta-lactamase n=1 Tax=Parafilimonas terrae TaxID=1465490 RepID=A0A1I5WA75_9BACT|nr:serine hydrolase domain-containing protein [Parafilimonas terrae]SFQ16650.1 Beta-lactamase [Parafilimonas terrae]
MKKIITACLLSCICFASLSSQPLNDLENKDLPVVNDAVKTRINTVLKSFIDSGTIAGVSALIYEKGEEVYFNAFGYANREARTPMDRNTIVRIYSMTKPLTGVALMTLYEKGAFQLDDPISKYAPEFKNMQVYKGVDAAGNLMLEPAKRSVTIRDVTRHTSGFVSSSDLPGIGELIKKTDAMNPQNTLGEMAKKLASLPLLFQPGEEWAYGPSVDIQAYLVERISGKPFDQYLQETILGPLQMTNTRYIVPESDRKRFAVTYRKENGSLTPLQGNENSFNIKDWPLKPGGFGLTSTVDDYMKFARMLVNKGTLGNVQILKPETVELMHTNQLSDTISKRMWLPSKGQVGFGIDFAVRLRPPATKSGK